MVVFGTRNLSMKSSSASREKFCLQETMPVKLIKLQKAEVSEHLFNLENQEASERPRAGTTGYTGQACP
jgi:hypothetical protein